MSQIFKRRANCLLRLALALLVVGAIGGLGLGLQIYASDYYTQASYVRPQPVPFSHRHHAGELGIDCRYCHTSVENSTFAGIPSPSTCMHCHRQIWPTGNMLQPVRDSYETGVPLRWSRVHNLPDYVYFNHSIHINKGIGCVSCHGRIDQMALTYKKGSLEMLWCLDCHRNPEKHVRPRAQVFNLDWKPSEPQVDLGKQLVRKYRIRSKTDCYTCHR